MIELRDSMIMNLKAFVKQSSTEDLKVSSYISYYRGLNVTTSFGQGRCSHVPWISFCGDQQTTRNGVYPVLFLYKSINILILAYGVSSFNKPKFEWSFKDGEKQTIKSFLQVRKYNIGRKDLNKYLDSYVYKAYDLNDNVDYGEITDDLDSIISIYQEFLVEKLDLNKTAPFIRNSERDEFYEQQMGDNKHKAMFPTPTSISTFITPKVAISYSWDNEQHKKWVLGLATDLRQRFGIDVTLDVWDGMKFGKLLTHFMEHAIKDSDRVICVMTPNYKKKTENLSGGVGMEYSVISAEIQENVDTDKFIPLFREGNQADVPIFLKGRSYVDMRDVDENEYNDAIETLARDIWNEPKDKKPQIGSKPKFD